MLEKAAGKTGRDSTKAPSYLAAWMDHPGGYPRLSERISLKPETGIYRRFDGLNARRLLYLQAELCIMEKELHYLEQQDKKSTVGKTSQYATDYQCMLEEPYGEQSEQCSLIATMHKKLNQYNKALIQTSTLHQLRAPDRFDLHDLQGFLRGVDMASGHLTGVDADIWGKINNDGNYSPNSHSPDIIGIHPRDIPDKFSRMVSERAIHLFKYGMGLFTKGHQHLGRKVYYDSTVVKITLWVTSMIAAMLPIASILVLIQLESLKAKLWTIAAFNVGMSFCLTFFADAKRAEVFAVTSAFAAVLVVFVSTDRGNPST